MKMRKKSVNRPTMKELADIQQPLHKDGYTNDWFDKLYGEDKNPWRGTERDRKLKNRSSSFFIPGEAWERIFGKKKKK